MCPFITVAIWRNFNSCRDKCYSREVIAIQTHKINRTGNLSCTYADFGACYGCSDLYGVTIVNQVAKKIFVLSGRDTKPRVFIRSMVRRIYMDQQRSISGFRLNINTVKSVSHFTLASGTLFSNRYHFIVVNMVPRSYSLCSFLPPFTFINRIPTVSHSPRNVQ